MRVETLHSRFTDAERRAAEQETVVVPAGAFPTIPRLGDLVRCDKDLTPALSEAWCETRRQLELGIDRERGR